MDPTVIHPCFYLRNDLTDSNYCRNGKVTPVPVFHKSLSTGMDTGPKDINQRWDRIRIIEVDSGRIQRFFPDPVSSEISDLCQIYDVLLFLSYFASQTKKIKPGN